MDILAIIRGLLAQFMSKSTQAPSPAPEALETDPEPSQVPSAIDWAKFKTLVTGQLGKPYVFGAEVKLDDPEPKAFDCSELVEWAFAQVGVTVPDGSMNQYEQSDPTDHPKLGDVGFFRKEGVATHHVGMVYDDKSVIEARGFQQSLENEGIKSNCVLLRARSKWEHFSEFTGWRRLRVVKEIEG